MATKRSVLFEMWTTFINSKSDSARTGYHRFGQLEAVDDSKMTVGEGGAELSFVWSGGWATILTVGKRGFGERVQRRQKIRRLIMANAFR